MLIIICLTFLLAWEGQSCPSVTFTKGVMNNIGSLKTCSLRLNGGDTAYSGSDVRSMQFYGYAQMSCDDCVLGLVSVFSGCDDCLWCLHNEGVEHCKSVVLRIIISSFISTIIVLLYLIILIKCKLFIKLYSAVDRLAKRHRRNTILKRQRAALKMKSYLHNIDSYEECLTEEGPTLSQVEYPKISHYLELEAKKEEPSTPEYVKREEATEEAVDSPPELPSRSKSPNFNKAKAAAGLALIMGSSLARACDVTSFVSSENKIYQDENLTTLFTGFYHMSNLQTLCLKYEDGKVDKLMIQQTSTIETYTPIYRTANFSLEVENPPFRCFSAGSCTYDSCKEASRHDIWKNSEEIEGQITYYGCKQGNDFCSFCSYYGQCKWYRYSLKPARLLYTVFKKIKSDWRIKAVYVSHDGDINTMIFSSNIISSETKAGTKISISSTNKPEYFHNDFLLESTEGSVWNTHANQLGDVSSSMIGNLQIGLFDSNQLAFHTHDVYCWSEDCSVKCKSPESGLVRGLKQYYNYTVVADIRWLIN